jgi:hypothetical protein
LSCRPKATCRRPEFLPLLFHGALNRGECRNIRAPAAEFRLEISTAELRSTKKQQSGPTNGRRIEGYVMVQRTDIAGSIRCSMGPVSPGKDGTRRHAPSALLEKSHLPPLPISYSDGKNCCRLFMTAVPSVHAIYVENL